MKKIIALGVVVFTLVALYSVAWFWAAGQATGYVKALETADGVETPRVVCGSFGISGWPFGFDATCTDATITSGDITVSAGLLQAAAEVYRPTHVVLFAKSPVTLDDAFNGSRSRLDFASAEASVRLTGWRLGRVSVVVTEPVLNDTVLDDRLLARASRAELHLIDEPEKYDAAAGLATLANYALVEGLEAPGLEIMGGKSTFEAELTNIPDDVRTYGDADLIRRWQAAGGKYIVTALKGDDATTSFESSGTLGLDEAGRIEGQVKLHSRGVVERLGPMLPEQYRGWIVGTPAADGSYSQTLNIAAGVVFAGMVPMGMIPPLY